MIPKERFILWLSLEYDQCFSGLPILICVCLPIDSKIWIFDKLGNVFLSAFIAYVLAGKAKYYILKERSYFG